ncbi:MAG: CRISPR-associated endonuclease Cas1, partial [Candidatus Marinimicrobia bacterium]|nr:CRISPR-associated endonuclease Cas1 [Candidatus Neomarinimicrobiota bacterium]
MQIVINKYGSSIQKSGELFKIYSDGKSTKISPKRVESIVISNGVSVSSDVVMMALKNNIEIYILDQYGNPVGRFWHARMGSTVKIRRAQLMSSMDKKGFKFGLKWIDGKFENQIKFLKNMQNRRTRLSSEIQKAIESISEVKGKINNLEGNIDELRNTILGFEGSAGRVYWSIYGKFISGGF